MFPLPREADDVLDDNVINTHVRNEVCRPFHIRWLPDTCAARCGRSSVKSALGLRLPKSVRFTILGGNALHSTAFARPCVVESKRAWAPPLRLAFPRNNFARCGQVVGPEWGSEEASTPSGVKESDDARSLVCQANFEGHTGLSR